MIMNYNQIWTDNRIYTIVWLIYSYMTLFDHVRLLNHEIYHANKIFH